ncbi:hypothetical protein AAFF_G00248350 [Aldrovandia affinis]|uniref:Uncharacterized protein n=1 Tax=Aldrovandia affinis TaxID=143900 RepID=A0AAD7RD74_9TELE|nr:hypothetical protein AAFF_G00248350 [Aldrovandia affinis]
MYLYRAACNDIPSPRLRGAPRPERAPARLQPPRGACCRAGQRPDAQQELKRVEEFLSVHALSLCDSVPAQTGMPYSARPPSTFYTLKLRFTSVTEPSSPDHRVFTIITIIITIISSSSSSSNSIHRFPR